MREIAFCACGESPLGLNQGVSALSIAAGNSESVLKTAEIIIDRFKMIANLPQEAFGHCQSRMNGDIPLDLTDTDSILWHHTLPSTILSVSILQLLCLCNGWIEGAGRNVMVVLRR